MKTRCANEGIKIVKKGSLCEERLKAWLNSGKYPARNPDQNIADIRAQIAANENGLQELRKMVEGFSIETVEAYMGHVQDNAEEAVRKEVRGRHPGADFLLPRRQPRLLHQPRLHRTEAKLEDPSSPSLQHLTMITTGVILVQLVLGAVYRHSKDGTISLHVGGACVVALLVGWIVSTVLMRFARQPELLHAALLLGGLLGGSFSASVLII